MHIFKILGVFGLLGIGAGFYGMCALIGGMVGWSLACLATLTLLGAGLYEEVRKK